MAIVLVAEPKRTRFVRLVSGNPHSVAQSASRLQLVLQRCLQYTLAIAGLDPGQYNQEHHSGPSYIIGFFLPLGRTFQLGPN